MSDQAKQSGQVGLSNVVHGELDSSTSREEVLNETATSGNYFTLARSDEHATPIGTPKPPPPLPPSTTNANADADADASASASASASAGAVTTPDLDTLAIDKTTRAEARRIRIEEAVKRSREEYKTDHAYTERGWLKEEGESMRAAASSSAGSRAKVDRQTLEYITTAHLFAGSSSSTPSIPSASSLSSSLTQHPTLDPTSILALVTAGYDDSKSLGGLGREVLETGIVAALRAGDVEWAGRLARAGKTAWKGPNAAMAATCSDALVFAGDKQSALTPLIYSTSSFGLHRPVLLRLSELCEQLSETVENANRVSEGEVESVRIDLRAIGKAAASCAYSRAWAWSKPLFENTLPSRPTSDSYAPTPETSEASEPLAASDERQSERTFLVGDIDALRKSMSRIDVGRLGKVLNMDEEAQGMLEGAVRRLGKGLKGGGEEMAVVPGARVERGVREL